MKMLYIGWMKSIWIKLIREHLKDNAFRGKELN